MRIFVAIITFFFFAAAANACMWDRDTLRQEYEAAPDIVAVITGRFERFPPRYYEMRLERVIQEIATNPENLALYDDAGVACDRLHQSDEAIEWMAKKRVEMDRQNLPADHEHRYRYEANLGTIIIHQWLGNGAPKEAIGSAKTARDHIKKAIEINPDAHFGREKYQLMAMKWLIQQVQNPHDSDVVSTPTNPDRILEFFAPVSFLGIRETYPHGMNWAFKDLKIDPLEAQQGVSGLITLGAAWESIDIQVALAQTLQAQDHNHLATLSRERIIELQAMDKKSFAPQTTLESFIRQVPQSLQNRKPVADFFEKVRKESDAWQQARFDFMEEKFTEGEHPDTHPEFWDGFRYSKKPPTPSFVFSSQHKTSLAIFALISAFVLPPLLMVFVFVRSRIKLKRSAAA